MRWSPFFFSIMTFSPFFQRAGVNPVAYGMFAMVASRSAICWSWVLAMKCPKWIPDGPDDVASRRALHAEIWYVPQESWELGVVAHIEGSEYRYRQNRVIFFSTSATASGGDEYLRYSQITFGPEFRARLTKVFSLSIQGGYTVERRFDSIDFLGKPHDRDLGNSGFVHVKFMLGPKTQKARYFATEQVIAHLR